MVLFVSKTNVDINNHTSLKNTNEIILPQHSNVFWGLGKLMKYADVDPEARETFTDIGMGVGILFGLGSMGAGFAITA